MSDNLKYGFGGNQLRKGVKDILQPPKPDTTALKRQENELMLQEKEQDAAERKQRLKKESADRARRGATGGGSLLTGLETGITPVKRTSLG